MAFLTIDDVPSTLFTAKLDYLRQQKLPAWFFIWGEKVSGQEDLLIGALRSGYLLGNHSWSHPHFSELSLRQARQEVAQTDRILADLYDKAGVPWNQNAFRFPYLDQGSTPEQRAQLQDLLVEYGYDRPWGCPGAGRDVGITFDQMEYWIGKFDAPNGYADPTKVLARIGHGSPGDDDIILIHDHELTHQVFFQCVDHYRELGLHFTLL